MKPTSSLRHPTPSPDAPRLDEPAVSSVVVSAEAEGPAKAGRLWLWFVAAFVVQVLVWAALFIVAHQNPVAEVPLVGASAPVPDARGQKSDVSRSSSLKP